MAIVPDDESPRVTPARWERLPDRAEVLRRRTEDSSPERPDLGGRVTLGAGGEFDPPGATKPTNDARRLFLEAVRDVEPRVLEELAGEPFAAFYPDYLRLAAGAFPLAAGEYEPFHFHGQRASSWLTPPDAAPPQVFLGKRVPPPPFIEEGRERRVKLLLEWGGRWRLDRSADDWCLWWATNTILAWCQAICFWCRDHPDWCEANWDRVVRGEFDRKDGPWPFDEWWAPRIGDPIPSPLKIEFPAFGWVPEREPWAEAEARIKADVDRLLREWKNAIDAAMAAEGYVRPTVKTDGIEHFRWLARWQVKRESFGDIAATIAGKKGHITANGVQIAVRETAALVGLERREGNPPGRPRKPRPPRVIKVPRP